MRPLLLLLVAGSAAADVAVVPAGRPEIAASLEPSIPDCNGQEHGKIHLRFADGGEWRSRGENSGDLKVAPDGRTVAWLQGPHYEYGDHLRTRFWAPNRLVIFRGRKILRVVDLGPMARGWRFWNDKVAINYGSHHGRGTYALIDPETGKVLAKLDDWDFYTDGKLVNAPPDWARPLVLPSD
jgi:hypothetical protein